jgi:putative tryptophan/tyrosine transport system substrate-binding protein
MRELQYAAQRLGITLVGVPLDSPIEEAEYRRVFALIAEARADALFVSDASENLPHSRLIVEAANTARLPAIYPWRAYVEIGGLMAYSINTNDLFRRAAGQVDQILKGAKPGNIPMYQPTSFALIVNIKTANSLNLTIPPTLLARADEVIE